MMRKIRSGANGGLPQALTTLEIGVHSSEFLAWGFRDSRKFFKPIDEDVHETVSLITASFEK